MFPIRDLEEVFAELGGSFELAHAGLEESDIVDHPVEGKSAPEDCIQGESRDDGRTYLDFPAAVLTSVSWNPFPNSSR